MKIPDVIATADELRSRVSEWRLAGARIALVPTMGALHEGHLSLVSEAGRRADRVIVSIFVNPMQFAPHEDLAHYPRNIDGDRVQLSAQGSTDVIFVPTAIAFYPSDFVTRVELGGPAEGLESEFRLRFFSGVATAVTKLFVAASPDVAVFGEKDYQQLLVVRRLVRDLGFGIEIVGCPVVREPDGLALSSRNAYLSAGERAIAGQLNAALARVSELVGNGMAIREAEAEGKAALLAAGFDSVDYLSVRDADTLAVLQTAGENMRILAAATIGRTRLIDNIAA